jgi:hypothetical protein
MDRIRPRLHGICPRHGDIVVRGSLRIPQHESDPTTRPRGRTGWPAGRLGDAAVEGERRGPGRSTARGPEGSVRRGGYRAAEPKKNVEAAEGCAFCNQTRNPALPYGSPKRPPSEWHEHPGYRRSYSRYKGRHQPTFPHRRPRPALPPSGPISLSAGRATRGRAEAWPEPHCQSTLRHDRLSAASAASEEMPVFFASKIILDIAYRRIADLFLKWRIFALCHAQSLGKYLW